MTSHLVLQSDFGLADGAVAAMIGVAHEVDRSLTIHSLTHEIPPYDVWEASYRLFQTVEYWPAGTVFVSVVDPGVGSSRRSVAVRTVRGHIVITPDNGTLTHLKRFVGIAEARELAEDEHRRPDTEHSYTFHGRDLYANTGAKVAAGVITFEQVGPLVDAATVCELEMGEVVATDGGILGSIDILDVRFGSPWTNITRAEFNTLGIGHGELVDVLIRNGRTLVYRNRVPYGRSFADVFVSEQLIYVNSLDRMAIAINQGNFARAYNIGTGLNWTIEFRRLAADPRP